MFFIFFGSEKKLGMVGKKNKGRTGVRERERERGELPGVEEKSGV